MRRVCVTEIVLLALVALFVGLRLYAVLGKRTGHEQQPVTRPEAVPGTEALAPVADEDLLRRTAAQIQGERLQSELFFEALRRVI